jgi:MFS family permease
MTAAWTPGLNRLTAAQSIAGAADALVAVSLAGSLFFNLSPAASREQVLLYLVINMAPFALLAPFIGPAIDRFHGGHRLIAVALFAVRGAFAAALAFFLYSLTFYFFALALLVAGKASGVTRQALVPGLVAEPDRLLAANARIARLGTIAAAVSGAIGAALLALTSASWTLGLSCALFITAAAVTTRLPTPIVTPEAAPAVQYEELHTPTILATAWAYAAVRAAVGFFVFAMAFDFRRGSQPAWMYGAAVGAYGAGSFGGLVLAPVLRRRYGEDRLTAGALIVLAVVAVFGALGPSRLLVLVVAGVLGMVSSIGRQGFDAMVQRRAPAAVRGRAFARFETWFQFAWVIGAIAATAGSVAIQVSLIVVALGLLPAAGLYTRAIQEARRAHVLDPFDHVEVARRRLEHAAEWQRRDQPRLAVAELVGVVDLARATDHHVDADLVRRLDGLRATAVGGATPDADELEWAVARTTELVTEFDRDGSQSSGTTEVDVTVQPDGRSENVNRRVDQSSSDR